MGPNPKFWIQGATNRVTCRGETRTQDREHSIHNINHAGVLNRNLMSLLWVVALTENEINSVDYVCVECPKQQVSEAVHYISPDFTATSKANLWQHITKNTSWHDISLANLHWIRKERNRKYWTAVPFIAHFAYLVVPTRFESQPLLTTANSLKKALSWVTVSRSGDKETRHLSWHNPRARYRVHRSPPAIGPYPDSVPSVCTITPHFYNIPKIQSCYKLSHRLNQCSWNSVVK
jgi:hypothetical protein